MPISREYARALFADLTQNAPVPLDPSSSTCLACGSTATSSSAT
ncbi:hypothetical protein ABZU45_42145 [Streptomyces avermitilis]